MLLSEWFGAFSRKTKKLRKCKFLHTELWVLGPPPIVGFPGGWFAEEGIPTFHDSGIAVWLGGRGRG